MPAAQIKIPVSPRWAQPPTSDYREFAEQGIHKEELQFIFDASVEISSRIGAFSVEIEQRTFARELHPMLR